MGGRVPGVRAHASAARVQGHLLSDPAEEVGALFDEHGESLYRYLVRLTGDETMAEDGVQHAFLRMLENRPENRNPRGWLYTVATRAVREWSRREARRGGILDRNRDAVPTPAEAPRPDLAFEVRRDTERIRRALDALPVRDRTVLLMRSEGFKHREIAQAVGTTTGSVGTLIARALDRLGGMIDLEKENDR